MGNNGSIPRNTRELYFYTKGEFEAIHIDMSGIKKLIWWIAGIMGTAIAGLSVTLIKGLIK